MTWSKAIGTDVPAMVAMAVDHFQPEIDSLFLADPVAYSRNLTIAVVEQFYAPNQHLVLVYKEGDKILAYTWAGIEHTPWCDEDMGVVKIAHCALDLSPRARIQILKEMMGMWHVWAIESRIPVICSTSMRSEQKAFLKLHERAGYDVRGAIAYKRLL